jgi:N-acetylglucosaminyl-diphospho-decaprenol L-rhamnosyltransferase
MLESQSKPLDGKIYVVVPVFNRKVFTQRFLECMRQQIYRNHHVIVVDDGSTDGTADLVASQFPDVQLLRSEGNLWWTGAINLGIRHALTQASGGDAILIINDDLEVNCDYLEIMHNLRRTLPRTLIGSVAVAIDTPEIIEDGGTFINWWTAKFHHLNAGVRLSQLDRSHCVEVSLLTGRGTLIPVDVFRTIGLYDDVHFQQCGDTELPVRAKRAGYSLVVSYAAVVKMHRQASDGVNTSTHYLLSDSARYFFGVKSNFRLKYRFFFSLKTASNPFAFVSFFFFDLLRLTLHFVLRLRLG